MNGTQSYGELQNCIFKLWTWQHSNLNSFSDMLYDLIAKADPVNRQKLALSFPYHVLAFQLWQVAGNAGEDLFDAFKDVPQNQSPK